jgi:hypothetical protein
MSLILIGGLQECGNTECRDRRDVHGRDPESGQTPMRAGNVVLCRLIRIYVTRLPLTVSDLPIMLKGLWGDSNRNARCVASALRILTKKGENGWG